MQITSLRFQVSVSFSPLLSAWEAQILKKEVGLQVFV